MIPDTLSVKMLLEERRGREEGGREGRERERRSGRLSSCVHSSRAIDRLLTAPARSAFCFEFQAVQERREIPCRGDKRDRGGPLRCISSPRR